MKKIILSVAMIAAVAAVAIGATTAYFSDTETSTGNTFTAGELDLRFQADGVAAPFADVNGAALFDSTSIPLLADMKPGDQGERTVKLWVDNNPACGTVSVDLTEDLDNSCNEPEIGDEPACASDNVGELNDNVNWAVWLDNGVGTDGGACNNIKDGEEQMLTGGSITEDKMYSIGELPTSVQTANCYGIAYCYGTWNQDGSCDGSSVNNASQSDSFKADIIINALQKRNQYPEGCPKPGDLPIVG